MANGIVDIEAFHRDVDAAVRTLEAVHRERLVCRRGCSGCCRDGLRVFEVEADLIRPHHADRLAEGVPHPGGHWGGHCALLDAEGACRISPHRPHVCRTQGLPVRWIDDGTDLFRESECGL